MRTSTIAPLAVILGFAAGCGGSGSPNPPAAKPAPDAPTPGDATLEALTWGEGNWDEVVWQ